MDPSRSEGVASRLPREESLSLYKNEWYDSNTDSTNSTSYNEEVVEKSVKLEEETSKGRMLPAHLTSIKKARVEGGYSGGSWEEGENGKEEDENGKEEDENGKEEDESDKGENESDDGDESDDEGASDDKDESDEEEDGSNKEEDKSGEEEVLSEDFTSSETAADTREHDTQQFVKKRDEERVTEAEAGHTEGLYRLRSQFYGAEAQASIAQSDSTSPYNSEENTRLSVLPIKPDTRFMYVWNMFDKEKTGELKANIFMQFLEKYEEFCWDSNEPLFSREELQAGKMHSSDLGYGKLEMSMSEVKGIVKVFAAEARFQGVMKSFDNENIGAVCSILDSTF
ncbi:hypothetical protein EV426DRAFT_209046 [Tirmania nivea]|nr:hypothetical protein EV426DRAFT_209046 [Tirmania nivea]